MNDLASDAHLVKPARDIGAIEYKINTLDSAIVEVNDLISGLFGTFGAVLHVSTTPEEKTLGLARDGDQSTISDRLDTAIERLDLARVQLRDLASRSEL